MKKGWSNTAQRELQASADLFLLLAIASDTDPSGNGYLQKVPWKYAPGHFEVRYELIRE